LCQQPVVMAEDRRRNLGAQFRDLFFNSFFFTSLNSIV
jgi:hypothetical protein